MPWNFLLAGLPIRRAGAHGGERRLAQHASNVRMCALAIEDLLRRAGAPDGVSRLCSSLRAVARSSRIPRRRGDAHGQQALDVMWARARVARSSQACSSWGSDPFIVMPSASFDEAVDTAVRADRQQRQSCIAAKRFIVHERFRRFAKRFASGCDRSPWVIHSMTHRDRSLRRRRFLPTSTTGGRTVARGAAYRRRQTHRPIGKLLPADGARGRSEDSPAGTEDSLDRGAAVSRARRNRRHSHRELDEVRPRRGRVDQ